MIIPHEYIDKDELLFEMTNAFIPQDMDTCRTHALAKKLIANAPAADVAPVVHGEWDTSDTPLGRCCVCSVCGSCPTMEYNYCPYCGADMRGVHKDVETT